MLLLLDLFVRRSTYRNLLDAYDKKCEELVKAEKNWVKAVKELKNANKQVENLKDMYFAVKPTLEDIRECRVFFTLSDMDKRWVMRKSDQFTIIDDQGNHPGKFLEYLVSVNCPNKYWASAEVVLDYMLKQGYAIRREPLK